MRVIAGKYKNRILKTVADNSVRPATDKVKGAIFNVMQSRVDWTQSVVLDLYAGSGSVGIEALSRGAQRVVFVENSRSALQFLKMNLDTVGANGNAQVVFGDVEKFLQSSLTKYSVVFADPPYALEALADLPTKIFERDIVAAGGYLIIEHPARFEFHPGSLWEIVAHKEYGRTNVSFFQHKKIEQ
ncbi:MAG: 16S rRNA (guanine(966)-N(2))-methyltransferase RsmD [Bacteroidota bacterium]|nr:16S rRNA (guanine(966)-N(2))-methyltransferase RsmD [Bacteroidota bacterium]